MRESDTFFLMPQYSLGHTTHTNTHSIWWNSATLKPDYEYRHWMGGMVVNEYRMKLFGNVKSIKVLGRQISSLRYVRANYSIINSDTHKKTMFNVVNMWEMRQLSIFINCDPIEFQCVNHVKMRNSLNGHNNRNDMEQIFNITNAREKRYKWIAWTDRASCIELGGSQLIVARCAKASVKCKIGMNVIILNMTRRHDINAHLQIEGEVPNWWEHGWTRASHRNSENARETKNRSKATRNWQSSEKWCT